MQKRDYDSILDFESKIKADKVIETNEGRIYFKDGYVFKIFHEFLKCGYYAKSSQIKLICNLDSNMFTIPIELIYIDDELSGFKMINGGCSLLRFILEQELSLEEKKVIAYQLKNISEYLKCRRLVHPDIHFCNALYLNNLVRLTDVNSILPLSKISNSTLSKKYGTIRMPEIYAYWLSLYGPENLDYLEINFCMHILFNFTKDELNDIYKFEHVEINPMNMHYFSELVDHKNTAFDDNIFAHFNDCFNKKRKTLSLDTYLIDHLK